MTSRPILHLNTETSWRGGESQTLRLAAGLRDRGHACLVVAPPGAPLLARAAAAGLDTLGVRMRGEFDLPAARRLAAILRDRGVGLLHYHTAHAVGIGTLATLLCGRRPAVAARRVSFPVRGGWLGRIKYTWRVDRIVAVSESVRQGLVARGIDRARIDVVHSGIDVERFARGDGTRFRASLKPFLDDAPAPLVVGTAAHLAGHKGLDRFLEAAALVRAERPGARFVVAGTGEREKALRSLVERLGLGGRVLFLGFRDDMPDFYAGLDVFALSSISGEGSPAVVKEAMAAGVPVAAAALDGVREIVEDARHGLLTPPGNAPALARAILLLGSDLALRARVTAAARQRVLEFTADRMVEKTEAVYRSLERLPWAR